MDLSEPTLRSFIQLHRKDAMNEWELIAIVCGMGGVIFGAVWVLMTDCKKVFHARVARCEHALDAVAREAGIHHANFITTDAFDRFERNLNVRFDGVDANVQHLTTRIDDFIRSSRNGKAKT